MSGPDATPGRWDQRPNREGRAHALERWRQRRDRAELDRDLRLSGSEDVVEVPDGADVRPTPGPQELGGLLGELVRARGWQQHLRTATLEDRWEQIVGPELARRSRPGRLEGRILHVVVSEGRWATQLQYLTNQIAGRVASETGIVVTSIRISVGEL